MKFHIVRSGEEIENIMFIYSVTKDELKQENKHIRDWNRLIPGTKLKIPVITETIDQDIIEMEPFVEDYYPKKTNNYEQPISERKEDQMVFIEEEQKPLNENSQEPIVNELNNNINKPIEETNEKYQINEKEQKKDNKPTKRLSYYPYYYYNPYYGQYFVYYYPIYS